MESRLTGNELTSAIPTTGDSTVKNALLKQLELLQECAGEHKSNAQSMRDITESMIGIAQQFIGLPRR